MPYKCKVNAAKRRKQVRKERLAKLYAMHDNKCSRCGLEDTTLGFFDFHHIDPSVKDSNIGSLISGSSMEKILKELDKCIMVCPNCHRRCHLDAKNP